MKKCFKFILPVFAFVTIVFAQTDVIQQKRAIVICATSGIGNALTQVLLEKDYIVGATGRRTELLSKLKKEHSDKIFIQKMDVTQVDDVIKKIVILFSTNLRYK